jgi:hypothetical protein
MRERFAWYYGPVRPSAVDEQAFPSTTYEYRKVKIKTPPAGHRTVRAKRGRWYRFATWPRHRKLSLTISHRGGAESWWLVEARGSHGAFPGHLCLDDVMAVVCNEPLARAVP